jgi:hypothetical protein
MIVPLLAFAMMQQSATVCNIRKHPSTYLKRTISIRAKIIWALPHGAYLQDDNCPKSVLLLGYDLPGADSSVSNLLPSTLSVCSPDSPNHKTHGDFTGRIAYSPKGVPEFRLESVRNLDNVPCPSPPPPIATLPTMHP